MGFKDPEKRRAYAKAHQRVWNIRNAEKRKEYGARWRESHREQIREKGRRDAASRRKFLHWLKSQPCTDCNGVFPPVCMDFDHVRGEKVADVGSMIQWTIEKIAAEVNKCELVCANCHRVRTALRSQEVV